MNKGEYGYMDWRKKQLLKKSLLWIVIVAALVIPGKQLGNIPGVILLVAGILCVLPGARVWVEYIVLFPYHTAKKDDIEYYEDIGRYFEDAILLYDLAIASRNKVRFVPICIIVNGKLYDTCEKIEELGKQRKTQQYGSELRREANEEIAQHILAECM